jgi:hypothetical protein
LKLSLASSAGLTPLKTTLPLMGELTSQRESPYRVREVSGSGRSLTVAGLEEFLALANSYKH